MAFHTAKSPSQAEKFANCAGSIALCEALPAFQKNISGPAAKLGTCVHFLIEHCLNDGSEPEAYRGRVITIANDKDETCKLLSKSAKTPSNQFWVEVEDDIIDDSGMMINYVRDRIESIGANAELELETRTNPLPDRDDTSGTADVTVKDWPVLLEVVDYKNGYNLVEHFNNKQLMGYLLGKALETEFAFARYAITVIQPNAEHDEGKIRTFYATAAELRAFQKEYRGYVEAVDVAAQAKGAPIEGDDIKGVSEVNAAWAAKYLSASKPDAKKDHCMFCDAKPVCPAYLSRRQDQASMDFADEPTEFDRAESADDIARILRWKPYFDSLFKAAFVFGQRNLENGVDVPGFKLSESRTNRKLIDKPPEEIAARIVKRFGLANAMLYNRALKTGPQIEKLLPKEKRPKFEKEFLVRPKGHVTIVPAEDAREEIHRSAGDDFDDLDELDFG